MLICPECKKKTLSFWEREYDMSCVNCREKAKKLNTEARLLAAFKAGKVKESQLTSLGRIVCGLPAL